MSKRVQIDVPCRLESIDGSITWVDMPGELLHDIAPHLARICTFAACMNPVCGEGVFNDYVVTSLETGLRVRGSHPTMREAIAEARKVLAGISPEHAELRTNEERPRDK